MTNTSCSLESLTSHDDTDIFFFTTIGSTKKLITAELQVLNSETADTTSKVVKELLSETDSIAGSGRHSAKEGSEDPLVLRGFNVSSSEDFNL